MIDIHLHTVHRPQNTLNSSRERFSGDTHIVIVNTVECAIHPLHLVRIHQQPHSKLVVIPRTDRSVPTTYIIDEGFISKERHCSNDASENLMCSCCIRPAVAYSFCSVRKHQSCTTYRHIVFRIRCQGFIHFRDKIGRHLVIGIEKRHNVSVAETQSAVACSCCAWLVFLSYDDLKISSSLFLGKAFAYTQRSIG